MNKKEDDLVQEEVLINHGKEPGSKKIFLESYGCAMNFSDSEIVASILKDNGFSMTGNFEEADVIFINTCAVRDNAEQRVRQRLQDFKKIKKTNPELIVGVLGCMAERLKSKLLEEEKLVDIVVGPDAYRDLPKLIETVESGQKAVNVLLSRDETYADINPVRLGSNGITAFISITRGCDNMCSFCVVPFTRGRERSRNPESIVNEAKTLFENGYREVTLLGQNVDSYKYAPTQQASPQPSPKEREFTNTQKTTEGLIESKVLHLGEDLGGAVITFAKLLEMVAKINPLLRVRFSTSHPKDMTDEVLHTIMKYDNICKYVHLPVQSGNSRILEIMNRGYDREWYINRINAIRKIIPDCGLSTDVITGFCSETEEEHKDTLSLMEWVEYDFAYMFKYSERPKTLAERQYKDDVPEKIKSRRLQEIVDLQQKLSHQRNLKALNKVHKVLVEGVSKKSDKKMYGRNSQNTVVVFPRENFKIGDYVDVLVTECTTATLLGTAIQD